MKNPYAKQIAREYRWLLLRTIFLTIPRLRRQKRRAERRGESIETFSVEADRINQDLKTKRQLYTTVRRADKMLSRAGWQ